MSAPRALYCMGVGVVLSVASAAAAQDQPVRRESAAPTRLETVVVTGSHIPRADADTALPIQVITREQIERSGATTPAEILDKVPANLYGFNDAASIQQAGTPGMSTANLRGLGDGATLVLLNGRRLANYAFYGSAVDINAIPLSAVERIEILKDGASAIYGSDAMAGVVNFVLRKDYRGAEVSGYGTSTQHGGGNTYLATATIGLGDLATDRYNAFVSASFQKNEALGSLERDYASTGFRPDLPRNFLSAITFPANIVDQVRRRNLNPAFAQGCTPPSSLPVPPAACGFDANPYVDLLPEVERASVFGRGTWQVNPGTELFAEALWSRNTFDKSIGPSPITNTPVGPNVYPAGGPYYPAQFAAANGLSGDLLLSYRTDELGPRKNSVVSDAQRLAIGLDGHADLGRLWDYSVAAIYSRNTQSDEYVGGYVYGSKLVPAMRTGLINPFGPSGPEGRALLASTVFTGTPHTSEATTTTLNGFASSSVAILPAGPLTVGFGGDWRSERLRNDWDPALLSGDPALGFTALSVSGDRDAWAVFGELGVPIARGLEAQVALRHDQYSDFGSSTNPKIALRWQPTETVLLRASWGTGFRAPPLYNLYRPASSGLPLGNVMDPVRCPVTGLPADCRASPDTTVTGNPELQPETSTQKNAGVVWQLTPAFSIGVDYWDIEIRDQIQELTPMVAFRYYDTYSQYFVRAPVDPAFPALPGPMTGLVLPLLNMGQTRTRGFDFSVDWNGTSASWGRTQIALHGTYVTRWETQLDGVNMTSMLGTDVFTRAVPRWRYLFTVGWNRGPWGATLTQNYTHGYKDFAPGPDGQPRRVDSFAPWDLQGTYVASKSWQFAAGVKNLFDTDPPSTNQPASFQVGYDPQLANPLGRLFYVRATVAWR